MKKILIPSFIVFLVFFHFQFVCAQSGPVILEEPKFENESKKELKNGEPDKEVKKEDTSSRVQEPQNTIAPSTTQESIVKPETKKKTDQPGGVPSTKGTGEKNNSVLFYLKEYFETFSLDNYSLGLILLAVILTILIFIRVFFKRSKLNKKYYSSYHYKSKPETINSSEKNLPELKKEELVRAQEIHFEASQEKTEVNKEELVKAQDTHIESSWKKKEFKISPGTAFISKHTDNIEYNRNPSSDGRACFEVFKKCMIKKNGVTVEDIIKILKTSLSKHYKVEKIQSTLTGLTVRANLKSMWERAITKAEVSIKVEEDLLLYKVMGTTSLGGWPWVWCILGFFTGIFLILFLIDLVEYIICRDRPKKYFEEAFNAVEFEIG
jgi:hypothetical protein